MKKAAKKTRAKLSLSMFDRPFMYRGLKIPPILGQGRPSATALAIRDALWEQLKRSRRKAARD